MEAPEQTNGLNKEDVRSAVAAIEGFKRDLESEKGAYMNRCRGIRDSITAAYDDAKEHGVPKKALRTVIKFRERDRKNAEDRAALEQDDLNSVEMVEAALGDFGDTPLGAATLDRARRGQALDSLAAE
jgi:uncharacterized protein (UPF0335 family)